MKIENIEVYGFRAALRGMRNPLESWSRSDSSFGNNDRSVHCDVTCLEFPYIGQNDMKLALSLVRGGGAHRKFLRMINVWWDITVPRAIWQEIDTYKVSTVRNSCSTMHKLGSRDLEKSDFQDGEILQSTLDHLNSLAADYRANKSDREKLHKLKMHLPESFLQKSTLLFSYETALHMYFDRREHRMKEWSGKDGICDHIVRLPYMREFLDEMLLSKTRG